MTRCSFFNFSAQNSAKKGGDWNGSIFTIQTQVMCVAGNELLTLKLASPANPVVLPGKSKFSDEMSLLDSGEMNMRDMMNLQEIAWQFQHDTQRFPEILLPFRTVESRDEEGNVTYNVTLLTTCPKKFAPNLLNGHNAYHWINFKEALKAPAKDEEEKEFESSYADYSLQDYDKFYVRERIYGDVLRRSNPASKENLKNLLDPIEKMGIGNFMALCAGIRSHKDAMIFEIGDEITVKPAFVPA